MENSDRKPLITDDVFHAESHSHGMLCARFSLIRTANEQGLDTARLEPLTHNHIIRLWKPGENRVTAKLTREGFLPC
jgi:hypothetical protein